MSVISESFGDLYKTSILNVDGNAVRKTVMRVEDDVLQHNQALRDKRSWRGEETLHMGRVPMQLLLKMANERGCGMEDIPNDEIVKELRANGMEFFTTYGGNL